MNDASIIESVLQGDPSQFQELVARYKKLVFRAAYAITGCATEAEDVLQEAFFLAYLGLAGLKDRGNVRDWLWSITVHAGQDTVRRRRRSPDAEPLGSAAAKVACDGAQSGEPDMKEVILSGLQELPEPARQVMMLRYVEGLSYREIGRTLGVTESAVGERLWRARQQFEKVLVAKGMGPK